MVFMKLSFDDFKRWMKNQPIKEGPSSKTILGTWVEPKVNKKKLMEKISSEDAEIEDLVLDFKRDGGIILEKIGKEFLIEVDSGTFIIPRNYVKRKSD